MFVVFEVIFWVLLITMALLVLCMVSLIAHYSLEYLYRPGRIVRDPVLEEFQERWGQHPLNTDDEGRRWRCGRCRREFPDERGMNSPPKHFAYYHRPVPVGPEDWEEWPTSPTS